LSVSPSSGSCHRPRLPETSIYYLSLIRDKLLPPLVLLLAREFFILGPKTVVGPSDKVWPRKIKAEGGEEREMRGFRGRIWRSLKTGVPHWASMRSFGTAPVQDLSDAEPVFLHVVGLPRGKSLQLHPVMIWMVRQFRA
jgi:hypothetical protein